MEGVIVLKNRKKILLMILIILIILFLLVIGLKFFWNNESNNVDGNINDGKDEVIEITKEEVVKDREISGILFSDISYIYDGKETIITLDITNNNLENINYLEYEFKIYDKTNNLISEVSGVYNKEIISGKKLNDLTLGTDRDLSEAYLMEISINKLEFVDVE